MQIVEYWDTGQYINVSEFVEEYRQEDAADYFKISSRLAVGDTQNFMQKFKDQI